MDYMQAPGGPYVPPPEYGIGTRPSLPVDGFAIASLVLGICWFFWIGSILAVVFGHIAVHHAAQGRNGGKGMAIAGLILGYTGVAILLAIIITNVILAASGSSGG